MKMHCWKCNKNMKKIKDKFHGFEVDAWKCLKCKEVIYDEKAIQPILQYNKLEEEKKELAVKVGVLGKSKIFRIPKIVEQIYGVYQGEMLGIDLEPGRMIIEMKR